MSLTKDYTFPTSSGYVDYNFVIRNVSGEYDGGTTYRGIDETLFVPANSDAPTTFDSIPSGYYDFGINAPEGLTQEQSMHRIGFSFIYSKFSSELFGKGVCTGSASGVDIGKISDIRFYDVRHNIKTTTVNAPAGKDWEG